MKVLLVLEDPTLDQYVVRPVVECVLEDVGLAARVEVLKDPHLRGVAQLLEELDGIVLDYPMIDLFVVVIDRDCDRAKNEAKLAKKVSAHAPKMIHCVAVQEVEVWMLAAQQQVPTPWKDVRAHCDPKERYAEPWLHSQGYGAADVGHGRKAAMEALRGGGYNRVLSRCDEVRGLKHHVAAIRR